MTIRNGILAALVVLATLGVAVGPAGATTGAIGDDRGEASVVGTTGAGETVATSQSDCSYPVTVTDTTGTEVRLTERPDRIVALQPSDAQTLYDIGAQQRVVGLPRTQYTAYLPNRTGRTNVKNEDLSVNSEQVIGLNPDLVLAANVTSIETVRQLRQAGITVYHFGQVRTIEEVQTNVETVGRLVGSCESAAQVTTAIESTVTLVQGAASQSDAEPRALYYFFGTTTGNGTHIHDVLTTAGAVNVAQEAGISGYAQINPEVVAQQDPDWIVYPDDATIPDEEPYTSTTAVQQNQTIELNSNYISQPGPRIVRPLATLADAWYPNATAAENGTATPEDNSLAPGANTTTATTTESGPGFGLVPATAALFALVAGLVVQARRRDQ